MQCEKPLKLKPWEINKNKPFDPMQIHKQYPLGYMEVPCGKCSLCRKARAKEWSLRILHELEFWESSSFITLTYRDEDLPPNASLVKSHLQNFFKRLRRLLAVFPIKYYACGEYGDRFGRPHYHCIILGLSKETAQRLASRVWWYGHVHSDFVTPASIRYVAQYVDTKLYGELAEEVFTKQNRQPPFQLSSQKLGLRFALQNAERFSKDLQTTFKGEVLALPRYYQKQLRKSGHLPEDAYANKSRESLLSSIDNALELGLTTVSQWERFRDQARTARARDLRTMQGLKPRQKKTV